MEFLCFEANHGQSFAVNILDLVKVMNRPTITALPGCPTNCTGIIMFGYELIAVLDIAMMFSGVSDDATQLIVLQGAKKYGILVTKINSIVRGEIPIGVNFIDPHDLERGHVASQNKQDDIELF